MSYLTYNQLTRLGNKKKHKKNKIAKLKKVFLFFHEKPMKAITIQEISYDRNDKVKMTVKTKLKNSIDFFKKEASRPLKR